MPDSALTTTVRPPSVPIMARRLVSSSGQKSDDERVETLVPVISLTRSVFGGARAGEDRARRLAQALRLGIRTGSRRDLCICALELWPTCPEATRVREVPRRSRSM